MPQVPLAASSVERRDVDGGTGPAAVKAQLAANGGVQPKVMVFGWGPSDGPGNWNIQYDKFGIHGGGERRRRRE